MCTCIFLCCCFFVKQKTAYEMRISDWSSDVCSSDLSFILKEQNEKDITLCVHPYIYTYLKSGFISRRLKWYGKFGRWIKMKPVASYALTEFHFFNGKEVEIKL